MMEEKAGGPGCQCEYCTGRGHCMGNPRHGQLPLYFLVTLPVLSTGQADDLLFDNGRTRLWLSRCTLADGESFNNKVTVEIFVDGPDRTVADGGGTWEVSHAYQAS